MAKLNKYANIYDKDGNLMRHIDPKTGKLEDYTIEELEELVDKLGDDKDENGKIKDSNAFNKASMILMQYYQKYGNPHMDEMIERIKSTMPAKTTEEEVSDVLEELKEDIKEEVTKEIKEEYVEFEEVK